MSSCLLQKLWYNRAMAETAMTDYTEEVRVQRMVKVLEHQVEHGGSIAEACEATGLSESTFHSWNKKGVLDDYLALTKESRVSTIRGQATLALPDVMEHMIALATGAIEQRGASSIRAAEFVLKVAGVQAGSGTPGVAPNVNILNLLPEQVVFKVSGGHPTLDDQGRLVAQEDIIEGEAVPV